MNIARLSKPETPRRAQWMKPDGIWKNRTSVNAARTGTNYFYHRDHRGTQSRSPDKTHPLWFSVSSVVSGYCRLFKKLTICQRCCSGNLDQDGIPFFMLPF